MYIPVLVCKKKGSEDIFKKIPSRREINFLTHKSYLNGLVRGRLVTSYLKSSFQAETAHVSMTKIILALFFFMPSSSHLITNLQAGFYELLSLDACQLHLAY